MNKENTPAPGRLRPVTAEDAENLFQWRNHPDIRKFMLNQEPIEWSSHLNWLEGKLAEFDQPASTRLFVFEMAGQPCGFMKFVPEEQDNAAAEWGFYASPEAQPGTGTAMCRAALNLGFGELGFNRIIGSVLPFNTASLKLHQKLGFTPLEDQASLPPKGETTPHELRFEITRQQWLGE